MDIGKSIVTLAEDHDPQKFYDLITTHGAGQVPTIEFIMRSLEHDGGQLQATHHLLTTSSPSGSMSINTNGMTMSMIPNMSTTTATTMELHPSMILQSLGLNSSAEGDESCSSSGDRPHVCQVCRASYKTRTHLRRHMTVHLNNRPYPCSECGKGFNRKEHLNKHIEAVHSGTKHKCQYCGKEISRKDHLSRHIKNMHPAFAGSLKEGDDQPVLKIQLPCGQKQKAQLSFLTPTFSPAQGGQTVTVTNLAGVSNSSNSTSSKSQKSAAAKLQQQNLQNQPQPQIILEQPFQQLIIQGSILVPNQVATLTVATTPSSSSGGQQQLPQKVQKLQAQNQNGALNNHNGLLGLTNLSLTLGGQIREAPFANCNEKKMILQVFTCTECNASFTSEKDLAVHIRSHKPQNFRCTECPRAYTRREKLTEHIRCFHQGQKFKCEYCGKELSRKDHVLRHVRSIHPEVLASRFQSQMQENVCDTVMNGQDGSATVLQGSNGSNTAALNEMGILLRSVCHVCLKVFGTSYHLSRHIESCHNGDNRPYPCSSCSKQFKRKDHLTKHLKSHCPSIRDGTPNGNSKKSLTNLAKIKMEGADRIARLKRMKLENGSTELSEEENEDSKAAEEEEARKQEDTEFNLAMLNSFIAENVNVVVEEEELSTLLLQQQQQQEEQLESEAISDETNNEIEASVTPTDSSSASSSSHNNQITTFNCGYCQKEFSSRDQLVDHIQEHSDEDIITQDPPHQEISRLELSSF